MIHAPFFCSSVFLIAIDYCMMPWCVEVLLLVPIFSLYWNTENFFYLTCPLNSEKPKTSVEMITTISRVAKMVVSECLEC